ncbi:MAG: PRC-barrel domain containing protein, partial [Sphingobacteriales bacterium]
MQNFQINPMSLKPNVMAMNKFRDVDIYNDEGHQIGKIQDYILSVLDFNIDYVVVSFESLLGIKDKLFIVPWSAFIFNGHNNRFVLPLEKHQLQDAPGYSSDWPH